MSGVMCVLGGVCVVDGWVGCDVGALGVRSIQD